MSSSPLRSPVILDATLSDEKLEELLALKAEYPTLDFKKTIDPTTTEGIVELAKDIGAMQVLGAYVIVGADNRGTPTGALDEVDLRAFDEANLAPMLRACPRSRRSPARARRSRRSGRGNEL